MMAKLFSDFKVKSKSEYPKIAAHIASNCTFIMTNMKKLNVDLMKTMDNRMNYTNEAL